MGEYDFRKGTYENLGFEYEEQMIAYLATAACNRTDLKDFWIASNVVGLGVWDDVILYTETQHGEKTLQFLQLKHKANIDIENKFKDLKDEFKKYERDYEQISSLMSYDVPNENQYKIKEILDKTGVPFEQFEFILMTNASFKIHQRLLVKSRDSFIKTNIAGPIYQLSPNMTEVNLYKNFFNQFYIFSEQLGVNDNGLLDKINSQLKHFLIHTNFKLHMKVANYLPTAIKELFLSENRTLSASDVKEKICSGILSALRHAQPVNSNCPVLGRKEWKTLKKLIEPHQLVVFSNDINFILKNFFDEQNSYYIISCQTTDIDFLLNCIKTAKTIKVIMMVPNEILESITETEISTLNSLNALSSESLSLLNDYDIKFQGRKTKFGSLLNQHSDIKDILKVDDIIKLLLGKLCFGEDNLFLSYYVPRSIPRIFVNKSIIAKMSNSFYIVIVDDNLVESELKIKSYLQSTKSYTKNNEKNEGQFNFQCVKGNAVNEAILNVESKFNDVHMLKYHVNSKDFHLEWLSSSQNIKEVRNFIANEKHYVIPIGDNLADFCGDIISKIIIVANPGMGKTYFLKNLANNYSVDSWIILITLNEIDFDKTSNFQSWLVEYYTKEFNLVDKKLFQLCLKKKAVVVLLDGFDEVAPEYNLETLNLINEVIKEKLKIVVTSREVTKKILEENLQTIAFTLNPFSNDDKIKFLQHFYSQNIRKFENLRMDVLNCRIEKFVRNFLQNCTITSWDEEFTGVPLQCRLLGEGFIENCQNYCESENLSNIPININLLTLYEKFIETKFNIYWKEKEQIAAKDTKSYEKITKLHRNVFYSNHMEAAVQIIFPKVGIKLSREYVEEIQSAKEKHGIIIGLDRNNNPIFIHRTFAEYFAAKWLVEMKERKEENVAKTRMKNFLKQFLKLDFFKSSKREEYLKFLLQPEYNVVRDLFDRIVCKHCELHTAVLNVELRKVRDILKKNGNRDDEKCGRNALHLISARGARHERAEKTNVEDKRYWIIERKEEEKYLEIVDCLLENSNWIVEKDQVLQMTLQQYADDKYAFGIIDRLCGSQLYKLEETFRMKWSREEILEMCATYDYSNIGSSFVDLISLDLTETKELLGKCIENDSLRFAEKIIQYKELKLQELTLMIYAVSWYDNGTLLHLAAQYGSVKLLKVLLKYIDVNIRNGREQTPLHFGCRKGRLSVVKALVENGGNLFLEDDKFETPTGEAIRSRNRELTAYVTSYDVLKIAFGKDINAALSKNGYTALYYAAMVKNMSSLKRLLSEEANVNIIDNYGYTALHMGCVKGYLSVVKLLVNNGGNILLEDYHGGTPIDKAIYSGNKELIEYVTSYDVLKFALGKNINAALDKNGRRALHYAAMGNNVSTVERLILKGANVNIKDKKGQTPLYGACNKWHVSVVQVLVTNGGNLFLKDNNDWAPMDRAIDSKNSELVKFVTSYDVLKSAFGKDVNAALDEDGRKALHYAAKGKNMFSLERLISDRANFNITDNKGRTALHGITEKIYFDANIVRHLLECGLDINAQNSEDRIALHFAARHVNKECVELLLQYRANPNIIDNTQRTALSLAREFGGKDIFLILWEKTEEELRSERDVLHKSVLTEGHNFDVRRRTFIGFPHELSHLVDTMSEAGLYYFGVEDQVECFSCECQFHGWKASDDPWVQHATNHKARNCKFVIKEKGKGFIESCGNK